MRTLFFPHPKVKSREGIKSDLEKLSEKDREWAEQIRDLDTQIAQHLKVNNSVDAGILTRRLSAATASLLYRARRRMIARAREHNELSDLVRIFVQVDADEDGLVSDEEVRDVFEELGVEVREDDIESLMADLETMELGGTSAGGSKAGAAAAKEKGGVGGASSLGGGNGSSPFGKFGVGGASPMAKFDFGGAMSSGGAGGAENAEPVPVPSRKTGARSGSDSKGLVRYLDVVVLVCRQQHGEIGASLETLLAAVTDIDVEDLR